MIMISVAHIGRITVDGLTPQRLTMVTHTQWTNAGTWDVQESMANSIALEVCAVFFKSICQHTTTTKHTIYHQLLYKYFQVFHSGLWHHVVCILQQGVTTTRSQSWHPTFLVIYKNIKNSWIDPRVGPYISGEEINLFSLLGFEVWIVQAVV